MQEKKEGERNNTFIIESSLPLSVVAGGGLIGFGGIAIYQPQEKQPLTIGLNLNQKPEAFGLVLSYDDVARVTVDENVVWINRNLPNVNKERQDVIETGMLKIELFENNELRDMFKNNVNALRLLGLNI